MSKSRSFGLRNWIESLPEDKARRLRGWTARGILIVIAFSLFALLYHQGNQYASDLPYFIVDPSQVRFAERPSWISEDIEKGILDVPCLSKSFSIFEPDVTTRIATAIEFSPWVRRVIAVRKRFPNGLDIEIELRRPVAYVDCADGFYPVDRTGTRLPGSFAKLDDAPWRLPCVLTADRQVPDPGLQWESDVVRSAADVADVLALARNTLPVRVAAIDVSSRWDQGKSRRTVTLFTVDGPRILWGSPPHDTELHGEPCTQERLDNLVAFAGRMGNLTPFEYVDLRFGTTVWYKERLASPASPAGILSASRSNP